ncbi:MAG TPA: radical SAM protein [Kiritimatiellia bacterium]|nr:radical SAM protein [Kiritimatiellia bacterium]HRZ11927.1 radical SAM protein [Kiritimatiellia bacterium]HSA17267.1 radical SAM protein [Kiritimatiellia bacterium]
MDVQEITIRSALVRSRIPGVEYVINPYLGCGHGCRYCYAVFMTKHSRHHAGAAWGSFVEAKTNIAAILRDELRRKRKTATAMLSSVCDPYQPAERRYKLTRACLEALRDFGWGMEILTRSPLVLRDLDILQSGSRVSVGFSVPTDDDRVRRVTEPNAPPIGSRIATLRRLKEAGIPTWAFIAPMLPMNPERLAELLAPVIDSVMMSGLNYVGRVAGLFRRLGWASALTRGYAREMRERLGRSLDAKMLHAAPPEEG